MRTVVGVNSVSSLGSGAKNRRAWSGAGGTRQPNLTRGSSTSYLLDSNSTAVGR